MKKYYVIFSFLVLSAFFIQAQEKPLLNQSSSTSASNIQDQSLIIAKKSILTKDSIFSSIEHIALNKNVNEAIEEYMRVIWMYIGEGDSAALYHANKSLEMSKRYGHAKGQAKSLEYKGLYHEIVEGDMKKALQLYFKAAKVCEDNQLAYLSEIYHTIGVLFHTTDNYEKAKDYYEFALAHARENKHTELEKKSLINLGSLYSSLKEYETAEFFFLQSLDITGMPQYDFDAYANLGNMHIRQNNFQKALPFLEKATEDHPDNNDVEVNVRFLIDAKAKLGDTTGMGVILKRAENSLETIVYLRDKSLLIRSLSEYYRTTGAFEKAFSYYDKYLNVYGEFIESQKNELAFELEAKYQNEKAQTTIAEQNLQLEKEASRRKRYLILSIFGSMLLFVSSMFLYLLWKRRIKLKAEIVMKENALNENELLLKELHHRTKNNLQLLDSLLSLQSRETNNQEVKQVLQSSRDSVGTISLLHHQLYKGGDFRKVPFQLYINDLCTYFQQAFGLEQRNIQLTCECPAFNLDTDKAIPLGLLINELVTNAIKHAFKKQGENGHVYIKIDKCDSLLSVSVEDNGVGMLQNSISEMGTGRKLIQIFIQRYEADFDYEHVNNGTKATFKLPV